LHTVDFRVLEKIAKALGVKTLELLQEEEDSVAGKAPVQSE